MNYVIFKVGLELCHHLEPCRGRYLEQLVLHLLGPTSLYPRQVTLEYVLFLLSVDLDTPDIEGASTVFQTFKKPPLTKKHESEQMILMFEAYKGFVWYALWQQSKRKVEQLKVQLDTNFIEEVELSHEENKMKILCERALLSLQMIHDQPGIWDIFITKYVDLLEWSGECDEIEPTLETYQNNNPHYPNAHRYLLDYYKRQNNTEKILPILQDSPEPWSQLSEDLIHSLESEVDARIAETFQCCWSSRYSWWPNYHFNRQSLRAITLTDDRMKLIASKAVVAIIFNIAADFVNEVKQLLSGKDLWSTLINRATRAADHLTVENSNT
ncbi:hypothetical protein LSH36_42g07012 [Paralvinella palmiformis]|uniref:Uncharacterized protein n=1 Tax=Paralvinella palmiformis TaxID=53620 RepID=A0AAD9NF74_9ANNE|nr:hypothetical protein LSH36_42g07012 [Paralvinella palmiformis]